MEAPFKIGQKVVCVKTYQWKDISVGQIYTVNALRFCCDHWVVSIGSGITTSCVCCIKDFDGHFQSATCFAPIPEQRERINYVAVSETLRETAVEIAAVETN